MTNFPEEQGQNEDPSLDAEALMPLTYEIGRLARQNAVSYNELQNEEEINSALGILACEITTEVVLDTADNLGYGVKSIEETLLPHMDDRFEPDTPFAGMINAAVSAAQDLLSRNEMSNNDVVTEAWSVSIENAALRAAAISYRLVEATGAKIDPKEFQSAILRLRYPNNAN